MLRHLQQKHRQRRTKVEWLPHYDWIDSLIVVGGAVALIGIIVVFAVLNLKD